jgi:hypothetical protein
MCSATAFRNAIKNLGLNYKAGKIFSIDDEAPAATPKKSTPKKSKKANDDANRTSTTSEESDEKGSSLEPSKKRKQDAEAGDVGLAGKKLKTEEDEDEA